jgi:hypothetical protein
VPQFKEPRQCAFSHVRRLCGPRGPQFPMRIGRTCLQASDKIFAVAKLIFEKLPLTRRIVKLRLSGSHAVEVFFDLRLEINAFVGKAFGGGKHPG